MKKTLFTASTVFFFFSVYIKAQGQGSGSTSGGNLNANTQWKTTGNTAQSTDYIGTNNSQPLVFKSNNTTIMEMRPTGDLIFSRLIDGTGGGGGGIIKVGGGGEGGRIDFTNNFSHVLNGQGIFTDISTFTGLKVSGNNIIQTSTGNIGIGVPNPTSKLSVSGGGSFTGDLNIGGNILSNMLTTNSLSVGSLSASDVSSTSLSTGGITASTLDLNQNLSFNGGAAKIGFTQTTQGGTGWNVISFGPHLTLQNLGCYIPPSPVGTGSTWNNIFGGRIQLYNVDGPGGSTSPNNVLTFQSDAYGASIDLAGYSTNTGNPNDAIAINYYCGKDVLICNNAANAGGANGKGGVVRMGQNLEIGGPISNYNSALNIRANGNKALTIQEPNYGAVFTVASDGPTLIETLIGSTSPALTLHDRNTNQGKAFVITNAANTQDVYRIYNDGTVWATEINVSLSNGFPDYVFEKDHNRLSFDDLKKYLESNKHLPGVPSAKEVEKNGMALGEMERIHIEKTEELYLYMLELNKKIESLEQKNEELQKQVTKLTGAK